MVNKRDESGDVAISARSKKNKVNKNGCCAKLVAPSDDQSVDVEEVNDVPSGEEEQSASDDVCVDHFATGYQEIFSGRG